eukprot:SAG31_NODE_1681_length_7537_cov_71.109572_4_plen_98_part_00
MQLQVPASRAAVFAPSDRLVLQECKLQRWLSAPGRPAMLSARRRLATLAATTRLRDGKPTEEDGKLIGERIAKRLARLGLGALCSDCNLGHQFPYDS